MHFVASCAIMIAPAVPPAMIGPQRAQLISFPAALPACGAGIRVGIVEANWTGAGCWPVLIFKIFSLPDERWTTLLSLIFLTVTLPVATCTAAKSALRIATPAEESGSGTI